MGEVAALFRPWQNNTTSLIMSMQYTGGAHFTINGRSFFESKAMMVTPSSTYSSTIATDNPLSESPSEEWRIDMLPIQFLFLNARPIIDMRLRCKSKGEDYLAGVPCHISKVLELKIGEEQAEKSFMMGITKTLINKVDYSEFKREKSRLRKAL
ncbi:hypothetical protein LguiB_013249 [Lonicera macranthoides]